MLTLNDFFIRRFLRAIFADGDDNKGLLLDLGCGSQPYRPIYERKVGEVVTADLPRLRGIRVQTNAEDLPFAEASFDWVIFTEVVEHVGDFERSLREISRVLRPDGQLVITWPFCWKLHELPTDFRRLTEFEMDRSLCQSGFDLERLFRRGDALAVLLALLTALAANVLEAARRIPVLGGVLAPLTWIGDAVLHFTNRLFAALSFPFYRLHPERAGERLSGMNSLALWTLGYCAVAVKRGAS